MTEEELQAFLARLREASQPSYGNRQDGSKKGRGYFGELYRPDGGVSTELSVQMDDVIGGKEFPLLVPTLSRRDVDQLLRMRDDERPPRHVLNKAADHASSRVASGLSPFARDGEQDTRAMLPSLQNVYSGDYVPKTNLPSLADIVRRRIRAYTAPTYYGYGGNK